jgi:hypothetical protein
MTVETWRNMQKRLRMQAPSANAASVAAYHALPRYEQARIIARAMVGLARYHARRRGEPEPIIQTFDAHLTEQEGVTIVPGTMREFDL